MRRAATWPSSPPPCRAAPAPPAFARAHPDALLRRGHRRGARGDVRRAGSPRAASGRSCAIYSTFLQRGYDNIIHDVAIQHLPVVFAWIAPGWWARTARRTWACTTSPTCWRCRAWWSPRPGTRRRCWRCCARASSTTAGRSRCAIRAMRRPTSRPRWRTSPPCPIGTWEVLRQGSEVAILAVGTMVQPALDAADTLAAEGLRRHRRQLPLPQAVRRGHAERAPRDHRQLLVVEEGTVVNGFGAFMASVVGAARPRRARGGARRARPTSSTHAPRKRQLARCGLDAAGIAERVRALHGTEAVAG